jgi:hypothetical protein
MLSLVPRREAMEETKFSLCGLVHGHFMFVLAALLSKGANPIMDPFVAINLFASRGRRCGCHDTVDCMLDGS